MEKMAESQIARDQGPELQSPGYMLLLMAPSPAGEKSLPAPAKAISPARDRLQSRLLVYIAFPLMLALCAVRIDDALNSGPELRWMFIAAAISVSFAVLVMLLKAATPLASAAGGLICFLLTEFTVENEQPLTHSALPPLALLFLLTFAATRFGRRQKQQQGIAEASSGRRASQVVANLGIAAMTTAFSHGHAILVFGSCVAALAEATADTVSSEIGQAVGGPTFLITNLRRVPPGTDGAISVVGTLAGLLSAAMVVLIALPRPYWSMTLLFFAAIFVSSIAGFIFDSLLGATLERRGYLGNDLVNFASTAIAAAIFYPLAHVAISFFKV